jgi:murein DD-endopeptidase MepM/ murein hydrolase activator NlpD
VRSGAAATLSDRARLAGAGADDGGRYGNLVAVAHDNGVLSLFAHLSAITVRTGRSVATGNLVGRVGATGEATGPHLHFEVPSGVQRRTRFRLSRRALRIDYLDRG